MVGVLTISSRSRIGRRDTYSRVPRGGPNATDSLRESCILHSACSRLQTGVKSRLFKKVVYRRMSGLCRATISTTGGVGGVLDKSKVDPDGLPDVLPKLKISETEKIGHSKLELEDHR